MELAKDIPFIESNIIISPYEEMIAYETLWALQGMSEKKLSTIFKENDDLPSRVLNKLYPTSLIPDDEPIDAIRNDIIDFIKPKLGSFSIVLNRDFQYPIGLRDAMHPIELFYYKGNLDLLSTGCISIVGARKVSPEGLKRTEKLAKQLTEAGFTIVSGLALGVDTMAHKTCIDNKGKTIGVIGTPIDQYYPKENKALQDQIAREHLLISQVPFYRYSQEPFPSHRQHFPRRNVTMASISQATIIVEASDTSGSLTQARACEHQNKKLFILDSCFKNPYIKWPSAYEKRGAIRVKSINDILDNLK